MAQLCFRQHFPESYIRENATLQNVVRTLGVGGVPCLNKFRTRSETVTQAFLKPQVLSEAVHARGCVLHMHLWGHGS